jgi:hypothetical protein
MWWCDCGGVMMTVTVWWCDCGGVMMWWCDGVLV